MKDRGWGMEDQMLRDMSELRKQALVNYLAHALESTIMVEGVTPETDVSDVRARLTDDSLRVLSVLVDAVDILQAIIWASDGCHGHQGCVHSMEPWQRARALLRLASADGGLLNTYRKG